MTRFISPTLVKNAPWDSRLLTEEIFGPILPIQTVKFFFSFFLSSFFSVPFHLLFFVGLKFFIVVFISSFLIFLEFFGCFCRVLGGGNHCRSGTK